MIDYGSDICDGPVDQDMKREIGMNQTSEFDEGRLIQNLPKVSWAAWLSEWLNLRNKVNRMSDAIADLKAAYDANKAEVQTDVASLQGKIADLSAQIANLPNVTAAITDLTAQITADTAALHASLNPDPAPSA